MKHTLKKCVSMLLSFVMVFGLFAMVPLAAYAVQYDETAAADYYNVVSKKEWELAPGITESEIIINNDIGDRRQVLHVVEVDIHNEYTKVIPSYKGMIPQAGKYGTQTMDMQAATAEAMGYGNVVAAMNLSLNWYDSAYYKEHPELVGEPLGYMILDGVKYTNSQSQTFGALTCLVINFDEKDGTARPDNIPKTQLRSTSDPITGWEEQVIPANFGFAVQNGKLMSETEERESEGAPRSMVGIKEDGTIIVMMNDGRQVPYSAGLNGYEMGEIMLSLGCKWAINGDGGGSSQFLSQRPGEELEIHCSPSDGSLRPTTHGILVLTTAPSDGTFVRAHVESDSVYYTPGSSVQFRATGTDLGGGAAEIPAEATWQLSDATMGTIDSKGLFVSNGKVGQVSAQLMYEGAVKGSATIQIVVPETISFERTAYVAPFGEVIELGVSATYGNFNVALKGQDYTIKIADDTLGTIQGLTYTAGNTGGSTTMTVTLTHNTEVTGIANLMVGKASETIFDFEEGTAGANLDNWEVRGHRSYYNDPYATIRLATKATGMVHSGEYSLALDVTAGEHVYGMEDFPANALLWKGEDIKLENATSIGLWLYVPEEATQTELYINYIWYDSNGNPQRKSPEVIAVNTFDGNESSGWHYVSMPVGHTEAYIKDEPLVENSNYKRNFFLKFYFSNRGKIEEETSYMGNVTYYIDDVTIDYSDVVNDRDLPTFSDVYAKDTVTDVETSLVKGTTTVVSGDVFAFGAQVSDGTKDNASGINAASARVYIDGVEVTASVVNGRIISADTALSAGIHRILFEIADNMGNTNRLVRYFQVAGDKAPAISVVPHNPSQTVALSDSVYWVDLKATGIQNVNTVEVKLDLDRLHKWELAHMVLAEGFVAESCFATPAEQDDNVITITFTNVGTELSGDVVLASLPIRVWHYTGDKGSDTVDGYIETDPTKGWEMGYITDISVNVEVEKGVVTYADSSKATFSANKIHIDTEAYEYYYKMIKTPEGLEYFQNNSYHLHTITNLNDQPATCTKDGYTGRTYCEVCDSVVNWGTVVPTTGHSLDEGNGIIRTCTCKTCKMSFSADGLTGWNKIGTDDYYFKADSSVADGEYTVDGHTYTFSVGKLIDAAWEHDGVGLTAWWAGKLLTGAATFEDSWHIINGNKYYFRGIYANTGVTKVNISTDLGAKYYAFDENGIWLENLNGLYKDSDEVYYVVNGICTYAGLVEDAEGNHYYINSSLKAVRNMKYYVNVTNSTIPDGVYYFDFNNEGVITNWPEAPTVKQGIVKDADGEIRYYVDDEAQYAGLVEDAEGNHYYINSSLKAVRNKKYYVNVTNSTIPDGVYYFDFNNEGIITNWPKAPTVKQGIVKDEDGYIRYYVDGVAQYAGLIKVDGYYYYFGSSKTAAIGDRWTSKDNGLLPYGLYNFDSEGRMTNPPTVKQGIVKDADGYIRYYVDGEAQYAGLIKVDGYYYYFGSSKTAAIGDRWISKDNGLLPYGQYNFDSEGRMTNPPTIKQGIVKDADGYIRYYVDGVAQYAGLIKVDGYYYYFGSSKTAAIGDRWTSKDNGLLPYGLYNFDSEGRMTNPPVA